MTISNAINNIQFTSVNIVTFTGNGTYTPPANLLWADIECVGGGGGSGGNEATAANQKSISAGGGGGGFSRVTVDRSALAPSTTITIGSGGAAGASGPNAGGDGGTTSVGLICQSTGGLGSGGGFAASTYRIRVGFGGGTGSGGDVNTTGASGFSSYAGDSTRTALEPQGGGASYFGGGGLSTTGIQGGGGGGRGRPPSSAAQPGFAGGNGLVVITEYLSA